MLITLLTLIIFVKAQSQQSHSGTEVKKPTYEFWEDMIQYMISNFKED